MSNLNIENKVISRYETKTLIIAEIGHNHQGEIDICKKLFLAPANAGVDAVKLQKRNNKELYTKDMYNATYNSENAYAPTYGEHREYLEFNKDEYLELKSYAKSLGLIFLATAFDFSSVNFLEEVGISGYKISSGDLKNIPLLTYIAKLNKPMIISTGGATMKDVQRAYESVYPINNNICLLQCTAGYPAKFEELNLKVIEKYLNLFPDIVIGLSDHHQSILPVTLGYMLGARVFEKHFTLSRASKGTDHSFSLEPQGLTRIVRDLRAIPIAIGDGVKRKFESEEEPIRKMGKMIVAKYFLEKGKILSKKDVEFKSPNDGLPPYMLEEILDRKLKYDVKKEQPIFLDLFE